MARTLGYLLLLAVIGFGIWPYYTIFRLDSTLAVTDPQAIAPYVDLPAIQEHYKERLNGTVNGFVPQGNGDSERVLAWLAQNLTVLGDGALSQAITVEWVRNTLRDAAARGTDSRPAYFTAAIDFAFFEAWNRFVIRLGKLGGETHVVLGLKGPYWVVTDVVR
ncbi:MAG: DUF2939 domain-containing protein [Thiohalocapsa sp.]